uniref:(northern house mosquito) hypothetical protein n=1 Tax=Culex pipiens TaxID=7175 RepID=A0A8D8G7D6_CULPI
MLQQQFHQCKLLPSPRPQLHPQQAERTKTAVAAAPAAVVQAPAVAPQAVREAVAVESAPEVVRKMRNRRRRRHLRKFPSRRLRQQRLPSEAANKRTNNLNRKRPNQRRRLRRQSWKKKTPNCAKRYPRQRRRTRWWRQRQLKSKRRNQSRRKSQLRRNLPCLTFWRTFPNGKLPRRPPNTSRVA